MIRIFTLSGVRSCIRIYIYISFDFIKDNYCRPNWFVIFITNDRSFRIIKVIWNLDDITKLSIKILCKSINSIPLLMNGILIKCRLWLTSESL